MLNKTTNILNVSNNLLSGNFGYLYDIMNTCLHNFYKCPACNISHITIGYSGIFSYND